MMMMSVASSIDYLLCVACVMFCVKLPECVSVSVCVRESKECMKGCSFQENFGFDSCNGHTRVVCQMPRLVQLHDWHHVCM